MAVLRTSLWSRGNCKWICRMRCSMLYKGTLVRTSGLSEYAFSDFVVPIDSEWAFALFLSKVGQNFILCKMLVHNDRLSFQTPTPEISLSIYWSRLCLRRYPLSIILQRRQVSLKYVSFSEFSWDNSNIGIAKSYEFLCHRWRKRHRHTIYIFPTGWGCFLGLSTFCTLPWLWLI